MDVQQDIDAIKAGNDRASIDYRCRKPNVGMKC